MQPKHRKIILLILIAVFIGAGAYFLLHSLGLVLDPAHLRIVKTGGIFLKFKPSDASLYLNDHPQPVSSGLLSSGVLINNLLPGTYRLRVAKYGFSDWNKNLSVESGKVTSATNIILWPTNPIFRSVASTTNDFWLSGGGIITKDKNNTLWFDKHKLRGNSVTLASPDSNLVITSDAKNYFLTNIEDTETALNIDDLFQSLKRRELGITGTAPIKSLFLHPFSPTKLLILTKTSLYGLDFKKLKMEIILTATSTKTADLSGDEGFLIDGEGGLYVINLILNTFSRLPVNIEGAATIKATKDGEKIIILTADHKLILYDRSSRNLKNIAVSTSDFYISPEGKRIAIAGMDGKISIFYLDNYDVDVSSVSGSTSVVPLPEMKEFKYFSWSPNFGNYFLTLNGGDLTAAESDPRSPLNSLVIASDVKKSLLNGDRLYVLKQNGELLILELSF